MPSYVVNDLSRESAWGTLGPEGYCSSSPPIFGWVETGPEVMQYTQCIARVDSKARNWNRLANYEVRLKAGDILPTLTYTDRRMQRNLPLLRWWHEGACVATPAVYHSKGYVVGRGGTPGYVTSSSFYGDAHLVTEAKLKCLAQVKDMSINLPVFFAEAGQTVGMLKTSLERIGEAAILLQRGRWRQAGRRLFGSRRFHKPRARDFANQILEWKYGWLPLMSDCYGAAKALCDHLGGKPPRCSYTAQVKSSSRTVTSSVTQPGVLTSNASGILSTWWGSDINCTMDTDLSVQQTARAGLTVSPLFNVGTVSSVGLDDPALLFWERIPFSHVFDWFIHVGNYLNAMTALKGLKVETGWSSQLAESESSRTFVPVSSSEHHVFMASGADQESRRNFRRDPWSGTLPPFGALVRPLSAFGLSQMISSAALYKQRF